MSRFHEEADLHWGQFFDIEKTLFSAQSSYQHIHIFENKIFGRVLVLDGIVQTTEKDEHLYHEMLVHVPLMSVGDPASVLIIGGGDGGTVREVLRHPIDRVTMVEIDAMVIEASRTHLPGLSNGAFDDPRLDLIIGDGIAYMMADSPSYDAIIVDSTDPEGPGEPLFTDAFYAACARRLKPDGILVAQLGMAFLDGGRFQAKKARLAPAFACHGHYEVSVPTYTGGAMGLGWASHGVRPHSLSRDKLDTRLRERALHPRYYSPARHIAAFAA